MHYAFDLWMARTYPELPWCRYADDGLVHCRSRARGRGLKAALQARLAECRLEMHPTKTKIVYCKDGKRKGKYPNVKFDFLGYCFRPRSGSKFAGQHIVLQLQSRRQPLGAEGHAGERFGTWTSAVEPQLSLADIAQHINPLLRGWISTMGDTRHRRWPPCSDTSIRRFWLGRCGSSSALKLTGSARAAFCKRLSRPKRGSLRALAAWHDRYVCLMGAE